VYIIVVDMNFKLSKETQENVEANIALREEVLNFATAGIRSSTREAHKAKPERLKISRRPKRTACDDSSKLITPLFFFRFVLGLPMEVAAVEKLINENSRRVNSNFHKQIRLSQTFQKQFDESFAAEIRESRSEAPMDIESAVQDSEVQHGDRRFSQRPTVVTGEASRSSVVVLDGGNPAMRLAPRQNDVFLEGDRLSSRYLLNGHHHSRAYRGSNTDSIRASEMVEVPSESDVRDVKVADETDDESDVVVDTNKASASLFTRLSYYFRAPIIDQSDWVEFTEFAPYHFRQIRYSAGITDQLYIEYFSTTIKERLTEGGASGAFFFFSKDEMFIAKSCSSEELETIKSNAEEYSAYMCAHKNSYISKIFGAYRLQIYGNALCFFVMNNIFLNPEKLSMNEKYDIKGSWVNRSAKPPRNGQGVTCTYCEQKFTYWKKKSKSANRKILDDSKMVSVDSAFSRSFHFPSRISESPHAVSNPVRHGSIKPSTNRQTNIEMGIMGEDAVFERNEQYCRYTVNGIHEPNLILKDNDLKHKIRMPYDTAIEVFQQLQMDADFLHRIGVMDYSLLVGVHNTEYEVSPSQASAAAAGGSSQSVAVPVSPAASMPQETPQIVSSRRHDVYRVVGPCAYYMGIIDFQQKWNFSKKMERFLKLNLHGADPEGLSAIAPDTYKERFIRKIEDILDFDDESKPSCAFLRIPSSHQLGQKTEVE